MDATAFGTFEWDLRDDVVRCSANVERQFGFSPRDVLTLEDVLGRIHPEDREAVRATLRRSLDPNGPRIYAGEFRTLLPDGRSAWIDARGAVMFSQPDRQAQCMVGIIIDITARKEREMQLHHAAEELGESNRMKDEFMATLAHELRNPLAPIRTGLEILVLQGLTNPLQRRACEVMGRQLKHIVHLVDDLLDISRINQHKLGLKKEIVSVRQVIDDAVETTRPQIDEANHSLQIEVPAEDLFVNADPVRIVQAISNLIANSARYTPPGGRIAVSATAARGGAEIHVRDNGMGIAPEMLPRVFEMFHQDTSGQSEAGLGIGLALTKALIGMHGGSVQAHSEGPGAGSTFRIWLPLAAEGRAVQRLEEDRKDQPRIARCRVLVVDDNRDAADSTATLLELMGHDVRQARDGSQAIEVAVDFVPDAILMDIGMPGVNGYEAARSIRELPLARQPTIVALTGWGPTRDPATTDESPFDAHLMKPVAAGALLRVLSELPRSARLGSS